MKRGAPEERRGRLYLSSVLDRAKELNLAPSKRLVLIVLLRYMANKDYCYPSQRTIAEDTGISLRQVKALLKEMADPKNGVIEVATRRTTGRKHGNHANEYRFKFPQNESQKCNLEQNQKCNSRQPKVQSATVKSAVHDSQKCSLKHSKVPETQASHGRAGAEYIKNRSKNRSVNQSGTDGLTEKEISDKKPASEEVNPLACNDGYTPPPGAPPRLTSEQINALFGGPGPRPVNLLDCPEGDIHLSGLVAPFKKGPEVIKVIGFDPDTPRAEWFEDALKEFYREVIDRHWNRNADPPGAPSRRLFYRAGRSGLLYDFGFRPLSVEQQEARQREVERQEEEAAEAARHREEERRRLAERDAALKEFIKRPTVRDCLDFKGIPRNLGVIRHHLQEIVVQLNGPATLDAIEQFMREELKTRVTNARTHRRNRVIS